jgi:hypothetical protein
MLGGTAVGFLYRGAELRVLGGSASPGALVLTAGTARTGIVAADRQADPRGEIADAGPQQEGDRSTLL